MEEHPNPARLRPCRNKLTDAVEELGGDGVVVPCDEPFVKEARPDRDNATGLCQPPSCRRQRLQAVGHDGHAEQEQPDPPRMAIAVNMFEPAGP